MYLGLDDPSGGHWRTDSTGSLYKRRPRLWLGLAPWAYCFLWGWRREEAVHICFFLKKTHLFFKFHVCSCMGISQAHEYRYPWIQMWAADLLELELHAVMSCLM